MNCKHATRLLSESLERPLGPVEKGMLRLHTSMCGGCRRFGQQASQLRTICQEYDPWHDPPPGKPHEHTDGSR